MNKKKLLYLFSFSCLFILSIFIDRRLYENQNYDAKIYFKDPRAYEKVIGEVIDIDEIRGIKIDAKPSYYSDNKNISKNIDNHYNCMFLKPLDGAYIENIEVGDIVEAYTRVGTPQTMALPPSFNCSVIIKQTNKLNSFVGFFDDDLVSSDESYKLDIESDSIVEKYKNNSLLLKYNKLDKNNKPYRIKPQEIIILD